MEKTGKREEKSEKIRKETAGSDGGKECRPSGAGEKSGFINETDIKEAELSPMMRQYMGIKEQYKDCILFFRLGDFYEMFFEDALTGSREMELTLTGKNCGREERAPMCGVPYHSADSYIAKLVEKGYKVALCEQVEDPAEAKGIVRREVVQVITPGTVVSQSMLREKENNYLASVFAGEEGAGLCYCDISTGQLFASDLPAEGMAEGLVNQLVKIRPREIIINRGAEACLSFEDLKNASEAWIAPREDSRYGYAAAEETVRNYFGVLSLSGLGLPERKPSVTALGALFAYLGETRKQGSLPITGVRYREPDSCMCLDKATMKNLELTETLFEKKISGSLLGVLDKTRTAMGGRLLKQWIREPLNRLEDIRLRLDAVELLSDDLLLQNNLREHLKQVYDLERLAGRVASGGANGRDLAALRNSLLILPEIKNDLSGCGDPRLEALADSIDPLEEVCRGIGDAIVDDPPFPVREGGLIREGYSEELDQIKLSIRDGQQWIAGLEGAERERTGIRNLKVGFNKVFGYYLEITRSYYHMIPENYIRKQTLVNCERFITPELKEAEGLVLNAETRINRLEYDLFCGLRDGIRMHIASLQQTAQALAQLDVLASFALTAMKNDYVKPKVNNGSKIIINKGRHPVIEQTLPGGSFVSNDTYLDGKDAGLLLITGPNMAGKSTYMRQTALIVLMAQIGSFVPCAQAEIGITDRIYTRIGASDNLAQGQSTFFVEMSELACILNTATSRSLVLLDEIGRGTSTYDGLSIAWAAADFLCRRQGGIRTLFATHYHELTALEGTLPGLKNLNVDVAEENGSVVFLHKIIEGSASRSYGIHVARLAGVPAAVLSAAEEKLARLESGSGAKEAGFSAEAILREGGADASGALGALAGNQIPDGADERNFRFGTPAAEPPPDSLSRQEGGGAFAPVQLSFFGPEREGLVRRLRELDLMQITPWEAIKILEELKEAAND